MIPTTSDALTCQEGPAAERLPCWRGYSPLPRDSCRAAVLEGDLATIRDAERINARGAAVVQLLTEGGCHLNATHVQQALGQVSLDELDLLIIENVGNPICPATFDLGEHLRIAALSVAEGHDKPSKYPLLFKNAQLVVLTKCATCSRMWILIPTSHRPTCAA